MICLISIKITKIEFHISNKSLKFFTTIKCTDPTFNEQVIRTKLNSLNTNKSTGVDKVHPNVLKECSGSLVKPLSI